MRELPTARLSFNGTLLRRGFWLYVWKIISSDDLYLYVGRTGDSSSAKAGSPFVRVGRHLDLRVEAKGNSLLRQLQSSGVDPVESQFELIAVGPVIPEASSLAEHRPVRDQFAAVENALAQELRERGYVVSALITRARRSIKSCFRRCWLPWIETSQH